MSTSPKRPKRLALPWGVGGVIGMVLLAYGGLRGGPLVFAAVFLVFSVGFLWFAEKKAAARGADEKSADSVQ